MSETATSDQEGGLFLTEERIAHELGIGIRKWRAVRGVFEAQGMRRRDPILGLRYWPAVKAFFDKRADLDKMRQGEPVTWGENLDAL